MTPERLIFTSVARRLDAGTYLPRTQQNIEIPAINNRPARDFLLEIVWPAACCATMLAASFIAACFLTNQWR